jgi:hypothetical protein
MAAAASDTVRDIAALNAEFDIFWPKVVQAGLQEIIEVTYKPIATIDQSDLEFTIPADIDFYIDPDTHIFVSGVSGQLLSAVGKLLDATDHTAVSNNLLHSLFSQCSATLNGTSYTGYTKLWL